MANENNDQVYPGASYGNNRKRNLIIAVIIILVILGLLWLFLRNRQQLPDITSNTNEVLEINTPSAEFVYDPNRPPAQDETEFSVINLAKNFAARLGSWSTDNPGKNLEELWPLSSVRMQSYLQNMEIDYAANNFSGITTNSLSASILSLGAEQAKIKVETQRIETKSDLSKNIYYQPIEISLVKAGDVWLVDGAYWQ